MALIKCIDCENMISEHAPACPNCGCPMSIILEKSKIEQSEKIIEPKINADEMHYFIKYRSLCKIPSEILPQMYPLPMSSEALYKLLTDNGISKDVAEQMLEIYRVNLDRKTEDNNRTNISQPVQNPYVTANVEAYIKFGRYKQDGKTLQDIEWRVLAKEENKMLVISRYGLDCKPYHTTMQEITWEKCSLRNWLNEEFYKTAFNKTEQGMIASSLIKAEKNPRLRYGTDEGRDTQDKVFLLSIVEARKYFQSDEKRSCQATKYAKRQGVYSNRQRNCRWWLRSLGDYQDDAACVICSGVVDEIGHSVNSVIFAVRPALWLTLDS